MLRQESRSSHGGKAYAMSGCTRYQLGELELPVGRRTLHDMKDQVMNGSLMAPSIIFDWHDERLTPRHLPPLGRVQGAFTFKWFTAVITQLRFPLFAVKETGCNHLSGCGMGSVFAN